MKNECEKKKIKKSKEKVTEEIYSETNDDEFTTEKNTIEEKEINEIGEILKKEIKKKLPEDISREVTKNALCNMGFVIIILLYFIFLILGYKNIERNVFVTDLKVFTLSILAISISLFELSYKKESKKIVLYGIECLVISFATMALLYICIINSEIFLISVLVMAEISIIYYIVKSIINLCYFKIKYKKENSELNVTE